jgi:hypothetical protein
MARESISKTTKEDNEVAKKKETDLGADKPKSVAKRHQHSGEDTKKKGISFATVNMLARRAGCASLSSECKKKLVAVFAAFIEKAVYTSLVIRGDKTKLTMRHVRRALSDMGLSIVGLSENPKHQSSSMPKRLRLTGKKSAGGGTGNGRALLKAAEPEPEPDHDSGNKA